MHRAMMMGKVLLPNWKLKGLYFTYALLLGVLAPAILKTKLPQIVEEQTGRKASVEDIAINPFLLKVDVRNFTIYASAHSGVLSESQIEKETTMTQPDSRFFSVGHMSLDVGFWHSVFTLTPAVEKLSIDAPFVTVARLNNTNNTQNMLIRLIKLIWGGGGGGEGEGERGNSHGIIQSSVDEFHTRRSECGYGGILWKTASVIRRRVGSATFMPPRRPRCSPYADVSSAFPIR